ncbi:MAG: hypothetical protein KIT35_16680 [Piscinibacter sp.]|uniref:HAD domain-containing protein n=1 Tax=Piscinibacter sp. TaxID=1903157 RepID=UPI00258F6130|nr:HAD domain-containing protein [Piscinibacter sp.]MCW5665470.1 hypothetical protein [Piscinibacter sp.]
MTHVLYLDFDGVLHHDAVLRHPKRGIYIDPAQGPGRTLFEWAPILQEQLEPYPDVAIVLSTSWVRVLGYQRAKARLPTELSRRVVGATFHSAVHRIRTREGPIDDTSTRGAQVLGDVSRRRPTQWLAVDDSMEGWPPEALERVVQCMPAVGLSSAETLSHLRSKLARFFANNDAT